MGSRESGQCIRRGHGQAYANPEAWVYHAVTIEGEASGIWVMAEDYSALA